MSALVLCLWCMSGVPLPFYNTFFTLTAKQPESQASRYKKNNTLETATWTLQPARRKSHGTVVVCVIHIFFACHTWLGSEPPCFTSLGWLNHAQLICFTIPRTKLLPEVSPIKPVDSPIPLLSSNKGNCAQSVWQKQCHCFHVTLEIKVQRLPENLSILSQTFILQCLNVGIYVYSVSAASMLISGV